MAKDFTTDENYSQSAAGEARDKNLIDWYAWQSDCVQDLIIQTAEAVVAEIKLRGGRHIGPASLIPLVIRYYAGMLDTNNKSASHETLLR